MVLVANKFYIAVMTLHWHSRGPHGLWVSGCWVLSAGCWVPCAGCCVLVPRCCIGLGAMRSVGNCCRNEKFAEAPGEEQQALSVHVSEYERAVAWWVHVCECYGLMSVHPTSVSPTDHLMGLCVEQASVYALGNSASPLPRSVHCLQDPTDNSEFCPPPHGGDGRLALSIPGHW